MTATLHNISRSFKTADAFTQNGASAHIAGEHVVHFYETDDFLLDAVSAFLATGMRAGNACIVIATPAHRAGLEERLQASGLDMTAAHLRGDYGHFRE